MSLLREGVWIHIDILQTKEIKNLKFFQSHRVLDLIRINNALSLGHDLQVVVGIIDRMVERHLVGIKVNGDHQQLLVHLNLGQLGQIPRL